MGNKKKYNLFPLVPSPILQDRGRIAIDISKLSTANEIKKYFNQKVFFFSFATSPYKMKDMH